MRTAACTFGRQALLTRPSIKVFNEQQDTAGSFKIR